MTYIGYKTLTVSPEVIDRLYDTGSIQVAELDEPPNTYIELRNEIDKKTTLGKVTKKRNTINRLEPANLSHLEPKNREQVFALDALLDKNITVVTLTGRAGSGKTFLTLAAAISLIERKKFKKIILTKPMSQVGKYKMGALPGEVQEKIFPYLSNYTDNLEQFVGRRSVEQMMEHYNMTVVPLQFIRGASFEGSLVIGDELQVLSDHEILTLGTRTGKNSKLVMMGDLDQRDENIEKGDTGLYKFINSPVAQSSVLTAHIELVKCERSPTAMLFSDVFE